jgi:hypothetical protein
VTVNDRGEAAEVLRIRHVHEQQRATQ